MQDSVASETVYGYPLNKRLLLGYEEALAGILGYTAARDSVNKQAEIFGKLHYDLPKIAPKERIFIEYADIERASPSKYNASNPIPEMEVYRQGTVYNWALSPRSKRFRSSRESIRCVTRRAKTGNSATSPGRSAMRPPPTPDWPS